MDGTMRLRTRAVAFGFWLGLLLALGTIIVHCYQERVALRNFGLIRSRVYAKVNLGMTRADAAKILGAHGIRCFQVGEDRCEFSDYWWTYVIRTNRKEGFVEKKYFNFNRQH